MGSDEQIGPHLATGRTAEVYALGDDRVVKVLRPEFPDEEAAIEARAARAITDAGVEAPALLDTIRIGDRPALVYARLRGPSMLDLLLRDRSRGAELAAVLGRLHAAMHEREADGRLPDGTELLRSAIRRAAAGVHPGLVQAALDRLASLPTDQSVCHGDMHPGNVVMTEHGPVTIDWVTASSGTALADVARTLMLLRDSPLPDGLTSDERRSLAGLRHAFADAYLEAYGRSRPFDPELLAAWRLPILVARLAEGIAQEREAAIQDASREAGLKADQAGIGSG